MKKYWVKFAASSPSPSADRQLEFESSPPTLLSRHFQDDIKREFL